MVGFGSLGGLGGRPSGFGASYPTRNGQPNSQAVDTLPFADREAWEADWQRRRQELIDNPVQIFSGGGSLHYTPGMPIAPRNPNDGRLGGDPALPALPTYETAPRWIYNDTFEPVQYAAPDFSGLDAERERMLPRYDALERNQQAYGAMSGNGQINGIIGPNYADPNFGQVTGSQPQQQAPSGVDMSWADVYQPGDTFSAPRQRPSGWGLW